MWNKKIFWSSVAFGGSCCIWHNWDVFINKNILNRQKAFPLNNESSYIYISEDHGKYFYDDVEINLASSMESYSMKHWNLLMLTKSERPEVRQRAVKSLAQLKLHNWQYQMISQACDPRTAVALARSAIVDTGFFLPSPFKNLDKANWKEELLQLITALSKLKGDTNIQQMAEQAKILANRLLKGEGDWNTELEDSFVIYHSERKKKVADNFDKVGLRVLLAYSAEKSYRLLMREKGILKLLQAVLNAHKDETQFQSIIAQILANFAFDNLFVNDLHITGWIGILAKWCRSSCIEVSLPAAKALANFDADSEEHYYYDNGVYLLHPLFRSNKKDFCSDVIFLHGLLGATFWTWRQHDSMKAFAKESLGNYTFCWPKDWLAKDVPNARFISVDYSTSLTKRNTKSPKDEKMDSLDEKANFVLSKLLSSRIGEKPIIWIAHSMGGLLVKQILRKCMDSSENQLKSIIQNTKGIIFFSVPHKGSDLVKLLHSAPYIFQPSIDIADLHKGSEKLLSMHTKFEDLIQKYKVAVLSFGETKKTRWGLTSSMLVTQDSSDPGVGEFLALQVDHLSTCKPESPESNVYKKVVEFLNANVPLCTDSSIRFAKLDFEISNILSLVP